MPRNPVPCCSCLTALQTSEGCPISGEANDYSAYSQSMCWIVCAQNRERQRWYWERQHMMFREENLRQ